LGIDVLGIRTDLTPSGFIGSVTSQVSEDHAQADRIGCHWRALYLYPTAPFARSGSDLLVGPDGLEGRVGGDAVRTRQAGNRRIDPFIIARLSSPQTSAPGYHSGLLKSRLRAVTPNQIAPIKRTNFNQSLFSLKLKTDQN
jgi:hypothetical protein